MTREVAISAIPGRYGEQIVVLGRDHGLRVRQIRSIFAEPKNPRRAGHIEISRLRHPDTVVWSLHLLPNLTAESHPKSLPDGPYFLHLDNMRVTCRTVGLTP